ncbi:ParB N-terminal domain-containing protein [Camelimonas lactis]|uniref:ParB family chromosome partitioning protein n=1 Tax=Camelimonas lactis TaxID=659006 RepID=A0A4R2GWN7_9HYPH|nr:ParB N-terminal domain-containing protein [Camelimonas lactis]TCO15214.1 ParB family chromosome partitioning protein [Camelimonas lactis]
MSGQDSVTIKLALDRIAIVDRLRPASPEAVEEIATSMEARGQLAPIIVRPIPPVQGRDHALVAGLHRIEAAASLGWTEIEAVIRHLDADGARMVEIDENLRRRELSVIDRSVFLHERKQIWERMYPETRHGGDRLSDASKSQPLRLGQGELSQPLRHVRFTREAAEASGLSERSVQIAVAIGGHLTPETRDALRGSDFEGATRVLHALAVEKPADQIAIANKLLDGAKTVDAAKAALGIAPARPAKPTDPEANYKALSKAWLCASDHDRQRFIAMLKATGEV